MAIESEKDIQQLKNRLRDLAERSFQQNLFTFTGFLGLSEQQVYWQLEKELCYAGTCLSGGCEGAERRILRFGNSAELGYEAAFPISCIHIRPLSAKFADELSHRDFLGALMNLGLERSAVGDIKVGQKEAWVFCQETIGDFICENLEQIRHTHVRCEVTESFEAVPQEEPKLLSIQVSSPRADAVLSKVYNKSRNECLELFRTGRVYIDGRLCGNNSRMLKRGETVNARGYGKFVFSGEPRETRKGKLHIEVEVYR